MLPLQVSICRFFDTFINSSQKVYIYTSIACATLRLSWVELELSKQIDSKETKSEHVPVLHLVHLSNKPRILQLQLLPEQTPKYSDQLQVGRKLSTSFSFALLFITQLVKEDVAPRLEQPPGGHVGSSWKRRRWIVILLQLLKVEQMAGKTPASCGGSVGTP